MGSQERSWLFFVICGDLAAKMKIFAEIYKFICIFQKKSLPLQPIWVQRRSARRHMRANYVEILKNKIHESSIKTRLSNE